MTSPIKLERKIFVPSLTLQSLPVVKSVPKSSTSSLSTLNAVAIPSLIASSQDIIVNNSADVASSKEKARSPEHELPIRVLMHNTRSGKPTKAAQTRMVERK